MELLKLEKLDSSEFDKRVAESYVKYQILIDELNKQAIPEDLVLQINEEIVIINSISEHGKAFHKQLSGSYQRILLLVERRLKLVPKHAYSKRWLAIGFSLFGISLGVTFGVVIGNMAYLGVGIPFGLMIGAAIGTTLDRRAAKEGRQLDVEF